MVPLVQRGHHTFALQQRARVRLMQASRNLVDIDDTLHIELVDVMTLNAVRKTHAGVVFCAFLSRGAASARPPWTRKRCGPALLHRTCTLAAPAGNAETVCTVFSVGSHQDQQNGGRRTNRAKGTGLKTLATNLQLRPPLCEPSCGCFSPSLSWARRVTMGAPKG